ncbi:MAG: hypothetical protein ACM31E_09615 [Fibrobacterota bacterium]|nr:hypothetical protein [Chitinispirillaceae bacterium]
MLKKICLLLVVCAISLFAQTKDAYETGDGGAEGKKGLLDPSRFSMQNSVSFGMASTGLSKSDLKSQSLYATMFQYRFNAPVTVNLNFGLPIHSTVSSAHNLNLNNIESLDYFKNMPISGSITWQPKQNFFIRLNVERNTYSGSSYYDQMFPGYFRQGSIFADSSSMFRR